jgi:hypothetical protein
MPIQLKHLFSDKYLALKINNVGKNAGSSVLYLSEPTEECSFALEPSEVMESSTGLVINFTDFFNIKSLHSRTPFYLHVMKPESEEFHAKKSYTLNASQVPAALKAKLFQPYDEQDEKNCEFVHNGDCIRLKQLEADSYLTSSSKEVDALLPAQPDFLKGQARRMHLDQKVERPKGGLDKAELFSHEKTYLQNDGGFERALINDDYIKLLKGRAHEHVYLETDPDAVKFTNSCWEIQRVNPLQGGRVVLDEVIRLRHIGTGKFLALNGDSQRLELVSSS